MLGSSTSTINYKHKHRINAKDYWTVYGSIYMYYAIWPVNLIQSIITSSHPPPLQNEQSGGAIQKKQNKSNQASSSPFIHPSSIAQNGMKTHMYLSTLVYFLPVSGKVHSFLFARRTVACPLHTPPPCPAQPNQLRQTMIIIEWKGKTKINYDKGKKKAKKKKN